MRYFENVEIGDLVYGFVYGKGEVIFVIDDNYELEGFYAFQVMFSNGKSMFYTKDGIPQWCNASGCTQTLYWRDDIDLIDEDFSPTEIILTPKKIMKLRVKGKLEMKCPSGLWRNVTKCPDDEFLGALAKESYHLFRKGV